MGVRYSCAWYCVILYEHFSPMIVCGPVCHTRPACVHTTCVHVYQSVIDCLFCLVSETVSPRSWVTLSPWLCSDPIGYVCVYIYPIVYIYIDAYYIYIYTHVYV